MTQLEKKNVLVRFLSRSRQNFFRYISGRLAKIMTPEEVDVLLDQLIQEGKVREVEDKNGVIWYIPTRTR